MMERLGGVEVEVAVPLAALWAVLTDFGHPQRLVASIEACTVEGEGVGAVRTVTSSRGLTILEQLVECDAAGGRFVYEVLDSGDMPLAGITAYRATVTFTPMTSQRTRIAWQADCRYDGDVAALTGFIEGLYREAIRSLAAAAHIESLQA